MSWWTYSCSEGWARWGAPSSPSARTTSSSTSPLPRLRAADPLISLASSNVGSLGGLVAVRDGLCHLAGSHLLDPTSGEYTLPYVDRLLGRRTGDRRGTPGPSGAGAAGGARQPQRRQRDRRPAPCRPPLRQPAAGGGHPGPARLRAGPGGASTRPRSRATPERSSPTWRWPRPSPPGGPTPGSASGPPRRPSDWTSSPLLGSPTTWCCECRCWRIDLLAPLWDLLARPDFQTASGAARRLLLSGDGPPDPVIPRPHLHPISTTLQVSQRDVHAEVAGGRSQFSKLGDGHVDRPRLLLGPPDPL